MNLELKALAGRLGIAECPETLEPAFEALRKKGTISCVADTLAELHADFDPFGEYYDFLLQGAVEIQQSEDLFTWLSLGVYYCKDATEKEAAGFPLPPCDESLARDVFPALLIAMEFPETVKRYRACGLDDRAIKKNLENLQENIHVQKITSGRVGLNAGLYGWMTHYTKARIFDYKGFNFQAWKWNDESILLRHRQKDEYVFLMQKGSYTAKGTLVGMRGAEELPALFDATLEESEEAFIGYRTCGMRVSTVRETFSKEEWEAVLRPGDDVINFHIPRGADLTPAHVEESIAQGAALAARYYPECNFKYTICTSWMLDLKLLDVLPAASKIAQFIRHFLVRPSLDTAGVACMSFVWPGETGSIEELSENTSLQRGIKRMMLDGKFNFWSTGVWI